MRLPRFIPSLHLGLVSVVVILGIVFWILASSQDEIEVGQVYHRAGLPDSAMVSEILEASPNEAGYLMVTILAFDRLVRIDQIGRCDAVLQSYQTSPEIIPLPIHLPGHDNCFAYRLRFDIPIPDSEESIPFTVAVIHPDVDRTLLNKPDE